MIGCSGSQPKRTLALAGPVGSLDAYIGRETAIPVVSRPRRSRPWPALPRPGRPRRGPELVLSHLRFVVHIARGYLGYGLPLGDLIQEGNIGLMKAVKRFDPDRACAWCQFRRALDQGRDARVHPAQLAPGPSRHDQGAAQALLQPAPAEAQSRAGCPREETARDRGGPGRLRPPKSPRWSSGSRRATSFDPPPGTDDEAGFRRPDYLPGADSDPAAAAGAEDWRTIPPIGCSPPRSPRCAQPRHSRAAWMAEARLRCMSLRTTTACPPSASARSSRTPSRSCVPR